MKKILLLSGLLLFTFISCNMQPFDIKIEKEDEPTIEENDELFKESNGSYLFYKRTGTYQRKNGCTIWSVKNVNNSEKFKTINVSGRKMSGEKNAGFGIVFLNQKYENQDFLLTVMINTSGQYTIGKVINGNYKTIQDWQTFTSANTGFGVSNTIEIMFENNLFLLKLNGAEENRFSIDENVKIKDSKWGYVVVIAENDRKTEKIIFKNEE